MIALRHTLDSETDMGLFQLFENDTGMCLQSGLRLSNGCPMLRDSVECHVNQFNQLSMIDFAGRNDDQVSGRVALIEEIEHLLTIDITDGLAITDDRAPQRVSSPEIIAEQVVNIFFRVILHHGDLLKDDPTFLLDFIKVEQGMAKEVTEEVYSHRQLVCHDLDVITAELTAGEAVQDTADRIDLLGDELGITARSPLKEHMLEKMRDPVQVVCFMTRPTPDPYPQGNRMAPGYLFSQDPDAII
jgi:hypothetical protein